MLLSCVPPPWGHSYCRDGNSAPWPAAPTLLHSGLAFLTWRGEAGMAHSSKAVKCTEGRSGTPSRRGRRGHDTASSPAPPDPGPPACSLHRCTTPAAGQTFWSTRGSCACLRNSSQSSCFPSSVAAQSRETRATTGVPHCVQLEDMSPPTSNVWTPPAREPLGRAALARGAGPAPVPTGCHPTYISSAHRAAGRDEDCPSSAEETEGQARFQAPD